MWLTLPLLWVYLNLHLGVCKELATYQLEKLDPLDIHEIPPTRDKKPLAVSASINIRNILDVEEVKMLVSLETTLRLLWRDPRIVPKAQYLTSRDTNGNYTNLNPSLASSIWIPDIFVDLAKDMRTPTFFMKPASLRVYSDSLIRYSARINFDVACNMDFRYYPVDDQTCEVKFESFGLQSNQIVFNWIPDSMNVNYNITLSQFLFKVRAIDSYATDYYDLKYPGLKLQIHLTRQIGYHLVQTYIPSTVFLVLAWMGLFIPKEIIPGRVGMGMTTILTQTSMFSATRQHVPKVSYITWLDVWMLVCMIFVFSTMVEFIVVTVISRKKKKRLAVRIEKISRLLLPCLFLLFNLIYWPNIMYTRWSGDHWTSKNHHTQLQHED
ncbi:glycine receptor subunit alpha-4 [Eurytemora carolleeae]|uniref:glycine receptor subunit alpha-4 n=1 Tax=Eurytemora carolleeae TaxID=1294199 RepID=UPI000C7703FA|nr:glycine receptor subunit alpha-4 [Eurytemora carolleeae]|eukprot:XP_023330045.1 glycine receptor subunit alpha-4-like [Eurytemora affinis]